MKALFLLGLLAGFAGVLAGAHFFPWGQAPRLPSATSVVANGGRAERFVIRLPADRLAAEGSSTLGLRAVVHPAGASLPPLGEGQQPVLLEQFKVRDVNGAVIGVAARHWTRTPAGPAAAWLLLLPGRGALMLTAASGEGPAAVDSALAAAGRKPKQAWSGEVDVVTADGDGAKVLSGSEEFDGLTGRYTETWAVTGVGADDELQGTVTLDTVTYRGS
ncbi:MAG TPA: hypothetical protein VFV10_03110 [Gammaproteobacteria bacterium]|nr:hypothetical protein [Gammaproteobacteria bacterium]